MKQETLKFHFSMGMVGRLDAAGIVTCLVYLRANEDFFPTLPWHWGMIVLAAFIFLLRSFYQEYFEIDQEKLQILRCSGTRFAVSKKLLFDQDSIHSFGVEPQGRAGYFLIAILMSGKTFSLSNSTTSPKQLIEHGKLLADIFSKRFLYTENTGPFEIKKLDNGNLEIKQKKLPKYMHNEINWPKMIIITVVLVVLFIIIMSSV